MKPIWHLFYKEWIKTRAAFFGTLIVGIGVVFYIFIGVENRITLMGAKGYTLYMLYNNPPVIYYGLLRYIPLLAAVCIGVSQYAPEVAQRRIRLTLHLPVGNRTLVAGMALYGLLLITLFNAIVLALFCYKNSVLFPAEVTVPCVRPCWGGSSPHTGSTTSSPSRLSNPTACGSSSMPSPASSCFRSISIMYPSTGLTAPPCPYWR